MTAVQNALVVGAGPAGLVAAALLADAGIDVDLVEVRSEVSALGSGITLQGNALRVLDQLGVFEECRRYGYPFSKLVIRAPDPAGTIVAEVDDIPFGGPGLPSTMGMYRPDLARVLANRADRAGVHTRFSTTTDSIEQDDDGVDVRFSDGTAGRYDVVVGADGLRSWTRRMLEIPLETRSVGLGAWRMHGPRPADVTAFNAIFGGPLYLAGVCPTSETTAYWSLVEEAQDRTKLTPEEQLETFRALSRSYHGPWDDLRDEFTDPANLNYTWFEHHLLDSPWNRGRVVLIGDAAHVCPPTIAQGAAMGLEDAAVLADVLVTFDRVDEAMWSAFGARRYDRVQTVVDASMQLVQWNLDHVQGDVPGVTRRVAEVVSHPA